MKKCDRTSKKLGPSFQSEAFPLSPPHPSSLTAQNLHKLKHDGDDGASQHNESQTGQQPAFLHLVVTRSRIGLAYLNKNVNKYFKQLLPSNTGIEFGYLASQHLGSEKISSDDGTESKTKPSNCMSLFA